MADNNEIRGIGATVEGNESPFGVIQGNLWLGMVQETNGKGIMQRKWMRIGKKGIKMDGKAI